MIQCKFSQSLLTDVFWAVWHLRFSPNDLIQKELLDRAAQTYVAILMEKGKTIMNKDHFFKAYPNILSQGVHHSFFKCFPKSLKYFDQNFAVLVCDTVAEWIVGLRPTEPWCLHWKALDIGFISKGVRQVPKENESAKRRMTRAASVIQAPTTDPGELSFAIVHNLVNKFSNRKSIRAG